MKEGRLFWGKWARIPVSVPDPSIGSKQSHRKQRQGEMRFQRLKDALGFVSPSMANYVPIQTTTIHSHHWVLHLKSLWMDMKDKGSNPYGMFLAFINFVPFHR